MGFFAVVSLAGTVAFVTYMLFKTTWRGMHENGFDMAQYKCFGNYQDITYSIKSAGPVDSASDLVLVAHQDTNGV